MATVTASAFIAEIHAASVDGPQNDFAVDKVLIDLSPTDTDAELTGLTHPEQATAVSGSSALLCYLANVSDDYAIVLRHNSAQSAAANRLSLKDGHDQVLYPGEMAVAVYNRTGSDSLWYIRNCGRTF